MTHPQTQDDEALVEVMARAICKARGWNPDTCISGGGGMKCDGWVVHHTESYYLVRMWQNCVPAARAALTALRNHEGRN